ncbi:MAG: hypothetical protein AAB697_02055 [Patescibacteria group bacterium]
MITYFEAGTRDFLFYRKEGFPKVTETDRLGIERHWQELQKKNPTGLFNGQIYSCNAFDDDGHRLAIGVNQVDYKTYKWARDKKRLIPGAYTMGNCMLLFDPKRESFTLLQRSSGVAFDTGKISGIGGVLDYKQMDMRNFIGYVEQATIGEVAEEVRLQGGLKAVALLGLYWDTETYKVEFAYYGEAEVQGVKADENKKVIEVPKTELASFTKQNGYRIEASTRVHLNHFASKLSSISRQS